MSYEEDLGAIGAQVDGRIDSLIDQVTVETLRADQAETEKAQAEQDLAAAEAEIARLEDELADCQGGEDPDPEEPEEPEPTGLTLTVEPGDGQARLTWTVTGATDTITGYQVGRDGTDTGGYGPWSTIDPPTTRERTFLALRNGAVYTLSVAALGGDETLASVSVQVTPQGATNPDPDPDPTPGTWLSGAAVHEQGNTNPGAAFAAWRGRPIEVGQTWPNTPDVWGINPAVANSWANWAGPMCLSYQPDSDWKGLTGWRSLAHIASGGMDAWWTAAAKNVRTLRQGKGQTYIAPLYEFNGDWMKWSVTRTTQGYADFRNAFQRISAIFRQEVPGVRIILPASMNRDMGPNNAMVPDPASFDCLAGTVYNAWPWEANGATFIQRLDTYRAHALRYGKSMFITEWANSANPGTAGGGGEAPEAMRRIYAWFKAHAGTGPGQLEGETIFEIDGYVLRHKMFDQASNRVTGDMPLTAAEYRRQWSGQ